MLDLQRDLLTYGFATRSLAQGDESGDLCGVLPFPGGALVAVIDGLGHGSDAAASARTAMTILAAHRGGPLPILVQRCHEALLRMRGVVMSLAAIRHDDATMTWISVGNIEGLVLRAEGEGQAAREHVVMRGGVVGHRLPSLRTSTVELRPGDTLLFATDGIRSGFERSVDRAMDPQAVAERVLQRYGKSTDDALIFVGRWNGGSHA